LKCIHAFELLPTQSVAYLITSGVFDWRIFVTELSSLIWGII